MQIKKVVVMINICITQKMENAQTNSVTVDYKEESLHVASINQ